MSNSYENVGHLLEFSDLPKSQLKTISVWSLDIFKETYLVWLFYEYDWKLNSDSRF